MALNKKQNLKLAEQYLQNNQLLLAIEEYGKIAANSQDLNIMNLLGDLYVRTGDVPSAIKHFIPVADNYSQNGFIVKAIAMYKKIHKLDPTNIEIDVKIAELYERQKLLVESRKHYEEALESYRKRNDLLQVIEMLKHIVTLDPTNIDRKLELALAYQEAGYCMKAEETYLEIGYHFCDNEKNQEAIKIFEKVLQNNPSSILALKALVNTLTKSGQTNKAIFLIKQCLEQKPNSIDLLVILGKTYLADNNLDDAEKTFIGLFVKNNSQYIYVLDLAKIFVQEKEFDRAINVLELVINAALQNNKKKQLIDILRDILNQNPKHEGSIRCLVDIYRKLEDKNNLVSNLEILLKLAHQEDNKLKILELLKSLIEANPEEISYKQELENLQPTVPKADDSLNWQVDLTKDDLPEVILLSDDMSSDNFLDDIVVEEGDDSEDIYEELENLKQASFVSELEKSELIETPELIENVKENNVKEIEENIEKPLAEVSQASIETPKEFSLENWFNEAGKSAISTENPSSSSLEIPNDLPITDGQIDLTDIFDNQEKPSTSPITPTLTSEDFAANPFIPKPVAFNPIALNSDVPKVTPIAPKITPIAIPKATSNTEAFNPTAFNGLAFAPAIFSQMPTSPTTTTLEKTRLKINLGDLSYLAKKNQPLEKEWRRAIRNNSEIAMIAIVVDDAETCEKKLGEIFLNTCIRKISDAIEKILYRGGDQILICNEKHLILLVLPETSFEGVEIVANRIKEIVSEMKLSFPDLNYDLTISQAITSVRPKRRKTPMVLIEKIVENLEKISESNQIISE